MRNDFYLATVADIVADPSAPNAFVQGIMEGKEWVWNNGLIKEADVADIKKPLKKTTEQIMRKADALDLQSFFKNFNFINKLIKHFKE